MSCPEQAEVRPERGTPFSRLLQFARKKRRIAIGATLGVVAIAAILGSSRIGYGAQSNWTAIRTQATQVVERIRAASSKVLGISVHRAVEPVPVATSSIESAVLEPVPMFAACNSGGYTVDIKSSPVIYVDCSNGNDAAYVAYVITNNTGSAVSDLWAELVPASPGDIALSEDGIYHVGPLANTASTTVYFFVKVNNCGNKATAQNLSVKLYATPPPFGSATSTCPFPYTVIDDVKASANKLDALAATPNPPAVGGLMTIDATGFTGNIGSNGIFAPTPASNSAWPADTFKLNDVTIDVYNSPSNLSGCNFSGSPTLTINDTLFVQNAGALASGNTACYKIHYEFIIQKIEPVSTAISPLTWISSGNLQKHNDDYTGTAVILQPAVPSATISKTASPTTATSGGTINYTITASNTGSTAIILDAFKDTLPTGMSYVVGSSQFNGSAIADPVISGQTQTWNGIFTVPTSGTRTLTFRATLPASVSCQSFTNSAFALVGALQIDSTVTTSDDSPATATVTGSCTADLSITKTDSVSSVNAGGTTTYSIVVNNGGPGAASNAIFKDAVATGLSVTGVTCGSASGGASCPTVANTTVALMQGAGIVIPTLPSGGSVTFTLTANVTAASGSITNTATIDPPSGTTDSSTGNNTASDTDTINPIANLAISKTDGVASVNAGGTTTYTIVVGNAGPSAADGAIFRDAVAVGISVIGVTCGSASGGASCPTLANTTVALMQGAGIVIPILPISGSVTFTVTANVTAASGSITNTATIDPPSGTTDSSTGNNTASDTDTINPIANLAISKTDGVASVNAGGTTTYTIVVGNAGPSAADGAIFRDAVAAGISVTGVTCGSASGGASCPTVANTTVALMQGAGIVIPILPISGSVTFTVTANVTAASGSITNTATIDPPSGTTDSSTGNNTASDTDTVNLIADLTIAKTDGVTSVDAGGTTTYTIVVSNAGPSAADGAIFKDAAATGISVTGVTCGSASGGASCPTLANTTVALMQGAGIVIPTLPSGGSVTFTVTASVTAASGSITNTATIDPPSATIDSSTGNNTASDTDTINPIANLAISKTDGVASVNAGGTTTYTIVVGNAGPSAADGAIFRDAVTAGISVTGVTCGSASGGASCPTVANTTVALMQGAGIVIPTLPSGGSVTFTVTANVTAASGSITNTATIDPPSGTTDSSTGNNTASDTDTVNLIADLTIAKTDGVTSVDAGGTTTYTIVVSNAGPSAATNAVFKDAAATGISVTGVTCGSASGGASCPAVANTTVALMQGAGIVIPTLPSGGSVTFTVAANVTAASGSITNTATIDPPSGTTDSSTGNNTASDTNTVNLIADLAITKTDGVTTLPGGGSTTYTIVVSNTGPSAADGAVLRDPAVAGLTVNSVSCGPASGGAVCPSTSVALMQGTGIVIASLPSGGSLIFTVTGSVANSTIGLTNTATVLPPGGTSDPQPSNNSASDTNSVRSADLSITKDDQRLIVPVGGTTVYSIVVSNLGASAADGAIFSDPVAAGISVTGVTCGPVTGGAVCPTTSVAMLQGPGIVIGTFPSGGSLTFSVLADVTSPSGTITNTATIVPPNGVGDPVPSNNTSTDINSVLSADVSITKTDSVTTAISGSTTTYTIVVSNAGPSAADGAIVTDPVAPGLTVTGVSCGSPQGGAACGTTNVTLLQGVGVVIPVLPSGGSVTFTVIATVTASNGTFTNTAHVDPPSGTNDPVPGNNTASDTDAVSTADVSITKTNGVNAVDAGGTTTYTIVVSNAGPSPADGAIFKDPPAAGLSATAVTCGSPTNGAVCPTVANTTVTLMQGAGIVIPTLPSTGSVTFTVTATVTAVGGTVTNTVTIAPPIGTNDPTPGNNTASETDTVTPSANLTITKTDGVSAVDAGGTTTYTILVSNAGPSPAGGAVFKDPAATGLNATSVTCGSPTNGAVCPTVANTTVALMQGAGIVIPTLPSTGSVTFTVTATITAVGGTITNTATIAPPSGTNDPTPGDNSANDTDNVTPSANLAITKTDGVTQVNAGGVASYTILISNAGPSAADGSVFGDAAVTGINVTGVTCGSPTGGAVCSTVANTTVALMQGPGIVIPTLPSGGSVTFTVVVSVTATTGSITNTATIAPPSGTNDPTPGNNSAQDTDTVNPVTDLAVTKTDGATKYTPGSAITYTIVVSNNGPSDATGVSISDSIPGVISGVSIGCVASGTASCGSNGSAGNNLSFTGVSISSGAGNFLTLTVGGTISSSASGDLANSVTVTAGPGQTDNVLTNNTAVDTDTIDPKSDLTVTKTDGTTTAIPGTSTVYTIVVSNAGPSDVIGAVVADNIPAGVTSWVWACSGATGGASGCEGATSNSANFTDTVSLPSGATVTYSVTAQINPAASGTLLNNVSVSAPQGTTDTNLSNNSASDQDTLTPLADLAAQKNGPGVVGPNGSVTYTIRVSNAGPSSANGAIVTDTLPVTGATWTCGAETGGATCGAAAGSGNMNVAVGAFPPGGSVTYTVTGNAPASGTFVNTATITASNGVTDPNSSNNSSSVTTGVGIVPTTADLSVIKSGPATVSPNGSVSYQIVVTNVGPAGANGSTVVDPVPLTGVTWSCGGETAGAQCGTSNGVGNLNTTIATFPAGASVTFTVNGTAPVSGSIVNTVTVAAPSGLTDPNTANNTSSVTTSIQVPSGMADVYAIKTGPATVQPNGAQSYKVIVGNSGPVGVNNATFQDDVPALLTSVTWTCGAETGGASCGTTSGSGNGISAVIANLPSNSTVTFTINATVPGSGQWVNSARVVLPTGVTDADGTNNIAGPVITNLVTQADLAVTKTDGVTTYAPGGVTTYTIVVTNNGPDGVLGATVTDNLPAGVTSWTWTCGATTGGASGCDGVTNSAANFSDTIDLPSGATITYTVATQTSPAATGNLINLVTVGVPAGAIEVNPTNNSASDTDTPLHITDLAITKTDGSTIYTPGSPISYTIVVTNNGPSNATGAVLTDTVPGVIALTSVNCVATGAASCGTNASVGNAVLLVNLSIAAGAGNFLTVTVSGNVSPSATGNLVNIATVNPGTVGSDPVQANNIASDTDTPNPLTDLAVTKTDNSPTYSPGSPISYTIVVSNNGPSNATGAAVVDAIPAVITGTNIVCVSTGSASCGANASVGNNLSFPGVSIAAGPANYLTFTVSGTVSPASTGDLTNIVAVNAGAGQTDLSPGNNTATDTDTAQPVTDLSITKTDGSAQYVPGGAISYTIVVRNAGPANSTGVSIADAVPPSITGVNIACAASGSANCGTNASAGNNLSFTGVSIPAGVANYLTLTVSGTVSAAATGNLVNTATVTAGAGQNDPTPANNTAVDTDTANPRTDLAVTKTDNSTTYTPGNAISYTIVVSNNGPSNASGISVADAIPAAITGVTIGCVPSGTAQCGTNASVGNNLSFTGVAIDAGAANFLTITVSGVVNAAGTGNLVNTVTASAGPGQTDPTSGNNSATDTDTSSPQTDLAVTKTDGAATYTAGNAISYTIVVSNSGPSNATGVSISDPIPAVIGGITIGCVSSGSASCGTNASVGNSLSFTGVSISSGAGNFLTLTVSGTVSSAATGNLVNAVTVTAGQGQTDPATGNNTATDTDTPDPKGDLAVTKTDGVATVVPGTNTVYTIVVSNSGPSDVTGAIVTDNIPVGLKNWAWSCSGDTGGATGCDGAAVNSSNFIDTVNLPAGSSITYTVMGQVAPEATGTLVNVVTVDASGTASDTNLTNNTATDQDSLTPVANLAVQKNGPGMVAPNGTVVYTIHVSNAGPSSANGAVVVDALPVSGATWTCGAQTGGATCGAPAGSGNINTFLGAFPPGGSVTYTVTGTGPTSGTFVNIATVTPPNGVTDPELSNNTSSVTTGVGSVLTTADLAVIKSGPSTVAPGGLATYVIVVTNVGPSPANGAAVVDPAPLTSVTWTCGGETAGASCGTVNGTGDINTTIATFPPGASVTFTVKGTAPASGSLLNTVTVAPPAGVTDPNSSNNTSSVTTTIQTPTGSADIFAIKTGQATVLPNGTQTYKVIIGNGGPDAVTNARFEDQVPGYLTNVTWTCGSETGGASCGGTGGTGNNISATIASLPPHSTVTFTINATVPARGQWVNSARVITPQGTIDVDESNNIAGPVITNLVPLVDLAVTKTDGSTTYTPGGTAIYTIVVTNNGPDGVQGATVTDNLPAGATSWSWACAGVTGGAGGCDPAAINSSNFSDTVDLPSGSTITYTVTMQISLTATGNLDNIVTVAVPGGVVDTTNGNNSATDSDAPMPSADLAIVKSVSPVNALAGDAVVYTIQVTNAGPGIAGDALVTDLLPASLVNATWTCVATPGSSCTSSNGSGDINTTVSLQPGGSATFSVTAHVALETLGGPVSNTATVTPPVNVVDLTPGNNISTATINVARNPLPGPGLPFPSTEPNDQKAGSILVYPIYTSNPANRAIEDTRLNLTNTDQQQSISVHLFFIDGATCSVADTFVCLTANQTISVLASDIDPGSIGYMIAVAVDSNGCPALRNQLIGDEYVKFASGHFANLGAEAISGLAGLLNDPACVNGTSASATLRFDGVSYNRLASTLAADSIPSRVEGNDTMLILNRIGGNLSSSALAIGTLFGVLYDDGETPHSFNYTSAQCQLRGSLTNDFPRTTPNLETVISAGHTGWMKLWQRDGGALFGASINHHSNVNGSPAAFNDGHNLRMLTLTDGATLVIPIFPPRC